jgi:hypothetical protein
LLHEELQKLDTKTRKPLYIHGQHHTKEDVDSSYIPRKLRSVGLKQLEEACAVEITKLVECVDDKRYTLMQIGRMHQLSGVTDS